MNSTVTRRQFAKLLANFLFPTGLVFLAAIVVREWDVTEELFRPMLPLFGYLVLGGGTVHGWLYRRSRAVFTLWVLFLAGWGLPHWIPPGEVAGFLPQAVALLVPINLLALSFTEERGVVSPFGLGTMGLLAMEVVTVLLLDYADIAELYTALTWPLFGSASLGWTWIGQPVLLVNLIISGALAAVFFVRRNPVDRGLFWALWAGLLGMHELAAAQASLYYFSVAGLMVLLSVAQHAHRIAYRDELTELPARRALNDYMQQLGRTYSIAMVDIDHFKRFNDRYGHDIGDQVLRLVASQLADVQGGGRAFRYGGEEFAVVFRGVQKREAAPFLELLRVRVEAAEFLIRGEDRPKKKPKKSSRKKGPGAGLSVTISIGVAGPDKGAGRVTAEQAIEAADKALYAAKKDGRNCVRLAGG